MQTRASTRQKNLTLLLEAAFSMAAFGRVTGLKYTAMGAYKQGKQETTAEVSRKVEAALGLPDLWMDQARDALPEEVRRLVHAKTAGPNFREDSPDMTARRIRNVEWLVGSAYGAKAAFCEAVKWHQSEFYQMKIKPLGGKRATTMETHLQLPQGWLDQEHDYSQQLPDAFIDRLAVLRQHADFAAAASSPASPAAPAATAPVAGVPLMARIESPITRALVEKLIVVSARGLLPEARALELLNEVVQLERT